MEYLGPQLIMGGCGCGRRGRGTGRPFHSCPHGVDCSFDPGPRPVPRKAFVLTPSTPFSLSSSPLSALCLVVTQMVSIVSRAPRYQM